MKYQIVKTISGLQPEMMFFARNSEGKIIGQTAASTPERCEEKLRAFLVLPKEEVVKEVDL